MYLFHHGGSITTKSYSSLANFSICETQLFVNLQFGGMMYVWPAIVVRIALARVLLPFSGASKTFSLDTCLNNDSGLSSL